MKRFVFFVFLIVFYSSCTVQDDRTGGEGDPDCPYCHGDGYWVKTDLLIFNTYYDCSCKSRNSYGLQDDYDRSNVSFEANESKYIRDVSVYIRVNGEWKYFKSVELWEKNGSKYVVVGNSSYYVSNYGNSPFTYSYSDEWGYTYYFD